MNIEQYKKLKAKFKNFTYQIDLITTTSNELTEDETDDLNLEAHDEKNPKCFEKDGFESSSQPENFLITTFYIEYLTWEQRSEFLDLIIFLLKDHHAVYVSQEKELKKIESPHDVEKELARLKPISPKKAIRRATTLGLNKKSLNIVNTESVYKFFREIQQNTYTGYQFERNTDFYRSFPQCRPILPKEMIEQLTPLLDPHDQFTRIIKAETIFEYEPRIGTLIIERDLTEQDIALIPKHYPNVSAITILDPDELNASPGNGVNSLRLLARYPQLSQLVLHSCVIDFDQNSFTLIESLSHLTELTIRGSSVDTRLLNTLTLKNRKLKKLELLDVQLKNNVELFFNVPSNHLQELTYFRLNGQKEKNDTLERVLNLAPKLQKIILQNVYINELNPQKFQKNQIMDVSLITTNNHAAPLTLSFLFDLFPKMSCLNFQELISQFDFDVFLSSSIHQPLKKLNQIKELFLQKVPDPIQKDFTFLLPQTPQKKHLQHLQFLIEQCTQLVHFSFLCLSIPFTTQVFTKKFNRKHLTSIETDDIDTLMWMTEQAAGITQLKISAPVIDNTKLDFILSNTPHLETLSIQRFTHEDPFTPILSERELKKLYSLYVDKEIFSQTTHLTFPKDFNPDTTPIPSVKQRILRACPNVQRLKIEFHAESLKELIPMNHLATVSSNAPDFVMKKIAPLAPVLHSIILKITSDLLFFPIKNTIALPQVKQFDIIYTSHRLPKKYVEVINAYIQSLPQLQILRISQFYLISQQKLVLPKTLHTISLKETPVDYAALQNLIAPHINTIQIELNYNPTLSLKEINQIKTEFPYIEFSISGNLPLNPTSSYTALTSSNHSIGTTELKPSERPSVTATKRFISKGSQPDPSSREEYVNLYHYAPQINSENPWHLYQPNESDLEACHPIILNEYDPNHTIGNDFYFGIHQYSSLQPNIWHLIPAPSTHSIQEQLITFWNDQALSCELKRDKILGFFWLRFQSNAPVFMKIGFTVYSPPYSIAFPDVHPDTLQPIIKLISTLRFHASGLLEADDAIQKISSVEKWKLIKALHAFCSFPDTNPPITQIIQGNKHALFNHLMQHQPGLTPCLARAELFTALNTLLSACTLMNTNDLHAFSIHPVTTEDQQSNFIRSDLGGAPVSSITEDQSLFETTEKHVQRKKEVEERPPAFMNTPELPPDHPFQTWKQPHVNAKDTPSLIQEIFKTTFKQLMLIVKTESCIETLHEELCKQYFKKMFFTPNLDALSLRDKKRKTALALFLEKPSDKPLFWFINWCNPKSHHDGYDTIFEGFFENISIPEHIVIVAITDETTASRMDSDFFKHANVVVQAPFVEPLPLPTLRNDPVREHDAVTLNERDWKKQLLRAPDLENGQLKWIDGKIISLVKKGEPIHLTIHTPPIHNPEFRWFRRELIHAKTIFFDEQWHDLNDCNLLLNDLTLAPVENQSLSVSSVTHELMVNHQTFSSLFPKNYLGEKGAVKRTGLLNQYKNQALLLTVTSTLSKGEYFDLQKHAKLNDNYLSFNILSENETAVLVSHHPQQIRAIVTNDIDYTLDVLHDKNTVCIPIESDTSFLSQFFNVKKQGDSHVLEKTELFHLVEKGTSIVFYGDFSPAFMKKIECLFTKNPYLLIQGEQLFVRGNITLAAEDAMCFQHIQSEQHTYDYTTDLKRLPAPIQEKLHSVYESLDITPRRAHFIDCPFDSNPTPITNETADLSEVIVARRDELERSRHCEERFCDEAIHNNNPGLLRRSAPRNDGSVQVHSLKCNELTMETWCDELITKLSLSKGLFRHTATSPTDPVLFLDSLLKQGIISLISESGAGKSYFMQRILPVINKNVRVFHGLKTIKAYASCKEEIPILFDDEMNIGKNQYWMWSNRFRKNNTMWLNGNQYVNTLLVTAGNPNHYGKNRSEPLLLKRSLNYMEFTAESIIKIISPLLISFKHPELLLDMIQHFYQRAHQLELPITPRNAENACLIASYLRTLFMDDPWASDELLIYYAFLFELNTLTFDRALTKPLRKEMKENAIWKEEGENLKLELLLIIEIRIRSSQHEHIWIRRDKKIAVMLMILLEVRRMKMEHPALEQHHGINGMLLEGAANSGLDQLYEALCNILHIKPVPISITKPEETAKKMHEPFHEGMLIRIRKYNTSVDEKSSNDFASGVDLNKQPPRKKGLFTIATQKPISSQHAEPISPAQINRYCTFFVKNFTENELIQKLKIKFNLEHQQAKELIMQYKRSKKYAKANNKYPAPDVEAMLREVEDIIKKGHPCAHNNF